MSDPSTDAGAYFQAYDAAETEQERRDLQAGWLRAHGGRMIRRRAGQGLEEGDLVGSFPVRPAT